MRYLPCTEFRFLRKFGSKAAVTQSIHLAKWKEGERGGKKQLKEGLSILKWREEGNSKKENEAERRMGIFSLLF